MKKKILYKQLPSNPPARRSQRLVEKSKKKQQICKVQNSQTSSQKQKSKNLQDNDHIVQLKKRKKILIERPRQLTNNVFPAMYNNMIRVTAILQIIQFRKKRQNCYSVRLSDGFHRIKVILMNQAGKQLAKQQIKQFYIIQCSIDHQGEGVCLVNKIHKWYQYGFCIGFTQPWKFNKMNFNQIGCNVIEWQKWYKFAGHLKKKGEQQKEKSTNIYDKIIERTQSFNEQNTLTMLNHNKQKKDEVNSKLYKQQSKKNFSTCKTQSMSISSVGKAVNLRQDQGQGQGQNISIKEQLQIKQVIPPRISQQFFLEIQEDQKHQQKKKNIINSISSNTLNSNKKTNDKIFYPPSLVKKQYIQSKNLVQIHQSLIKKSQIKNKRLLLSSQISDQDSCQNQNKVEKLERTQTIKEQSQINKSKQGVQDSWQGFFEDLVVYQKMKKDSLKESIGKDDLRQKEQISIKQEIQTKKQIISDLFQDSDSDNNQNGQPQSLVDNEHILVPITKRQSQMYSPQHIKSRNYYKDAASIFQQDLHQQIQLDSRLPPVKVQSCKKQNGKIAKYTSNHQKGQKINLKWVSKELSNIKNEQRPKIKEPIKIKNSLRQSTKAKSFFQDVLLQVQMQQEKNQLLSKQKQTPLKASLQDKNNINPNQVLISIFSSQDEEKQIQTSFQNINVMRQRKQTSIQTEEKQGDKVLKNKVYALKDLIENGDFQNFSTFKGLNYLDSWYLKIKFLYIGSSQNIDGQKSNFCKPTSKIKQSFIKCIGASQDNKFICTVMISAQLKEKYSLKQQQSYLIQNPSIYQNNSVENQFTVFPTNMYMHWLQISSLKNCRILEVSPQSGVKYCQNQQWIDSLGSIDQRQDNDVVNVMGFIKSIRQNNLKNNNNNGSKFDDSNSKNISVKSNNNFSKNAARIMIVIQIVDPFTGQMSSLTDFTDTVCTVKKFSPISIFRARVNTFKNKKSIISKAQTIIIYDQFIRSKIGSKFQNYLIVNQSEIQKIIQTLQVHLVGYQTAYTVYHASNFSSNSKIHLTECQIFSITKVSYIGCKKCGRKILQGKCPSCGAIKKQDIMQKIFYSGLLGDDTGSLRFSMDKIVGQRFLSRQSERCSLIDEAEQQLQQNPWNKYQSIESVLSLSRVEAWFTYQSQQKPINLQKIQFSTFNNHLESLFEYVSSI